MATCFVCCYFMVLFARVCFGLVGYLLCGLLGLLICYWDCCLCFVILLGFWLLMLEVDVGGLVVMFG